MLLVTSLHRFATPPLIMLILAAGCTSSVVNGTAPPTTSASPSVVTSTRTPTPRQTPTASPTPSPSPSLNTVPSFPSAPATETPDEAAVRAGWEAYLKQLARYAADPTLTDLTDLANHATDNGLPRTIHQIQLVRERNEIIKGGAAYTDVTITIPHPDLGLEGSALVHYCFDRSRMQAVDAQTGEAIPREVGNLEEQATMQRGSDGQWRLDSMRNRESTC